MPSFIEGLGQQTAGGIVGAGLGLVLGGIDRKNQLKQQQKLQNMQIAGQMEMSKFNQKQQMEMWEATNYKAQMEQLKKAGLNPGLIYGMGGGAGGSTQANTGNVTGGAAAPSSGASGMGMSMQGAGLMAAQMELIKAQTNKTNVEAEKLGGVDTAKTGAETDLVRQNIKNAQAQEQYTQAMTAWQNLETKFAGESYQNRQKQIDAQLNQTLETVKQIGLANNFTKETWDNAVAQIAKNVMQTELHNQLLEVQKRAAEKGIQLTDAQIGKLTQDVAQGWEKLRLEGLQGQRETVKLEQVNMDLLLKEMQTTFNVTHPGLWNVVGGTLDETMKKAAQDIYNKIKNVIPKL